MTSSTTSHRLLDVRHAHRSKELLAKHPCTQETTHEAFLALVADTSGAEAWAAYLSLGALATRPLWLRAAIALIVPTNVIGGALWAMPGLVKKARHALRKGGKAA